MFHRRIDKPAVFYYNGITNIKEQRKWLTR